MPLTNLVRKFADLISSKSTDFYDLELSLRVTKVIAEAEKILKISEE